MKPRTTKKSTSHSKPRKGLSRTAKVVGATTVGALAGGLIGSAITKRRGNRSAMGRTAQKVKSWVKSATTSPAVKSLAKGVAQQMVETRLGQRPTRKGQSGSSPGAMMRSTGKGKKKK